MAKAAAAMKPQAKEHEVVKRITYRNPADKERYNKEFERGTVLTFPHLSDEDYALLLGMKVIKPKE